MMGLKRRRRRTAAVNKAHNNGLARNGDRSRSGRHIAYQRDETGSRELASVGLPDFETSAQCIERNQQMLGRLQNHEGTPPELIGQIQLPADDDRDLGYDGNWLASRSYRAILIPQAYKLLRNHAGPFFFVTIAHPKWELPAGQLNVANVNAAKQWLGRRLQRLPSPVIVVGGYEASLRVELNGYSYWAGHLHLVIAGASERELKSALKIERRYRKRKYSKPLKIEPIGNLVKRLGYSTKRIVKRAIAYIGKNGRQQRRELPLSAKHQVEFDLWLLGLPVGHRTILFGCRFHGDKLCKTQRAV